MRDYAPAIVVHHGKPALYHPQTWIHLTLIHEWWYPPYTRVPLMTPPTLYPRINPGTPPQTGGPEL